MVRPVPEVTDEAVRWHLADAGGEYVAVRLLPQLPLPQAEFARNGAGWELTTARPPLARLEYRLEVARPDGSTEAICDPGNPRRVSGAFGPRSVLELPGYAAPWWLRAPASDGHRQTLAVDSVPLASTVVITLWSPAGDVGAPLPLLLAHDGPEYDELSSLTRYCAALIAAGRLPTHRVALLHPGSRDEWYSASEAYARALATELLPTIGRTVPVVGAPVGMGASLGGLAMLHAQRSHPGTLGGLFLQSSPFFIPRHDHMASGFERFGRIARFVRGVVIVNEFRHPVPAALTCGREEENIHSNRRVGAALRLQGYAATLHELPDLHNYTAWRDAFDPHLTSLLERAWGKR